VHPAINIILGDSAIQKYWEEGPIAVAGLAKWAMKINGQI